jgi:hypothetical protein
MNAYIQIQDITGNWRTHVVTPNISQNVLANMKSLQQTYPNFRIRAVDEVGRVIDIL